MFIRVNGRNRYNYTGYTTPDGYDPSDDYIVLLPDSLSATCRRFRLSTLTATDSNAWRFHMLMFWTSQVYNSTTLPTGTFATGRYILLGVQHHVCYDLT